MRIDRYDIKLLDDDICIFGEQLSYGTISSMIGLQTNIPHYSKDNEVVEKLCNELHEKLLEIRR